MTRRPPLLAAVVVLHGLVALLLAACAVAPVGAPVLPECPKSNPSAAPSGSVLPPPAPRKPE